MWKGERVVRDYEAWHRQYDDPTSSLAQRLAVVQRRLAERLSAAAPGAVRIISMCAGQGRDLLGVLPAHPRRGDVTAVLVELDHRNVEVARASAAQTGLTQIDVLEADAAVSDIYAPSVPADIVLACGIFGNISDQDLERTVRNLSMLCRTGASVIWTRHRNEPDLTPRIRGWFTESGFEELSFDAIDNESKSGIGTVRLIAEPLPFQPGFRFFTFTR
ncbi:MAG TPA: class I SAM-dependent methyltransferase [Candidatus Acidoferrum sp.]|nr:class I SAM-dependent methyltransferase [Candidatus Acidoferrum sp.]